MQKNRTTKASVKPISNQKKIAEKYIDLNKTGKYSYKYVAELFTDGNSKVTENQVRYYVEKHIKGSYKAKKEYSTPRLLNEKAKILAAENDIEAMIESEIEKVISIIKADEKMNVERRVSLLNDAVSLKEKFGRIKLERIIKSIDAEFLFGLCKHFQPDISEEKAMQICLQVKEKNRVQSD